MGAGGIVINGLYQPALPGKELECHAIAANLFAHDGWCARALEVLGSV